VITSDKSRLNEK
jgi:hypothetical protein